MNHTTTTDLPDNYITAREAILILGCGSGYLAKLQLQRQIVPVPTVYPRYYYKLEDVAALAKKLTSKRASREKV